MRAAALDGSIEQRLIWHKAEPGDFFYIPANTVHASGAGVSLIEVQQNSNMTYRLYDYGRPRELHLDEGLAVATGEPYARKRWHKKVPSRGSITLVDGPLFLLDQIEGCPSKYLAGRYPGVLLVIPRSGPVEVDGEALPLGYLWARQKFRRRSHSGIDRLSGGALLRAGQPASAVTRAMPASADVYCL